MKKSICLVIHLFTITFTIYSQKNFIDIDRLGRTHSPFVVPKKWLQIESGFLKQTDKIPTRFKETFFQHPVITSRYGLSNRIELRFITDWVTERDSDNITDNTFYYSGVSTFDVGGKFNLIKEKGIKPEIALIAHYSFNRFKSVNFGKDSIDGVNFRFAFQHTIKENFWLNYNVGMIWRSFRSEPTYIYTLSPRFKFDENWCAFVEVFGNIYKKHKPEHSISAGLSYRINDNFMLDAAGGIKLNERTPDNFYTIGCSFRFKTSNKTDD